MAIQKNYYDTLQILPSASFDQIKQAYRLLAKKYHPDAAGNENNTHLFFEIQVAYETLSNPTLRQAYHYKHFFTAYNSATELQLHHFITNLNNLYSLLAVLQKVAINYSLLQYQLQQNVHINYKHIIENEKNNNVTQQYINIALKCVYYLPYSMAIHYYTFLIALATKKQLPVKAILQQKNNHQLYYYWHAYKLFAVVVAVATFCYYIYRLQ